MLGLMLGRTYDSQTCSVAGSLEVIGERWTMLIVRDAFMGARRFEHFQRRTGAARNVLANRLNLLVEEGIFRKVAYQEHPARYEYRLTEKGIDLFPVIAALLAWGDKHASWPGGPAVVLTHRDCGADVRLELTCADGHVLGSARDVTPLPGPGARRVAA
jgi:DNA-binding HxlR family transcriptional regulator